MGLGVEEMRKKPFLAFRQIEGGGKRGETEGKETQTVLERQPSGFQAQDFRPHANLIFDLDSVVVEVLEDEHPVVAFEIVKNHHHFPGFVRHFRFGQQPIVKFFGASSSVKHQSRQRVAMIFPFGTDEDGHVQLVILRAFEIRVYEIGRSCWPSFFLLLLVRGLVVVGGQETHGVGGTTRGRTAWSFGRRWSSILLLRVWISHRLHVTSMGGDLHHILAGFAHVGLALVRALTFASNFSTNRGICNTPCTFQDRRTRHVPGYRFLAR